MGMDGLPQIFYSRFSASGRRRREGRGGAAVRSARAKQRLACCAQSLQADLVVKEQRATASGTSGIHMMYAY